MLEFIEKNRLGLSLKHVRGPLRRCLSRFMVFHRFDHAAHLPTATLHVQPIEAKSLSHINFPLF